MLLIIIDVLERLLAWLKPFSRKQADPSHNISDVSSLDAQMPAFDISAQMPNVVMMGQAPSDQDVIELYNSLRKKYPLKSAPSSKICGVENAKKVEIIPPSKQDSRVWNEIDNRYGEYVTVANA